MSSSEYATQSEIFRRKAEGKDYTYEYPNNLDLHPIKGKLHQKLLERILRKAQLSYDAISCRHASWKEIDETLNVYIPIDDKERALKEKDPRKPISVVVPQSYAILDTLLTNLMKVFAREETFRYVDTDPNDAEGAFILTRLMSYQYTTMQYTLAINTWLRDAICYGVGAVTPYWYQHIGKVYKKIEVPKVDANGFTLEPGKTTLKNDVIFEGNRICNIDPYKFLPDPNVSISDTQHANFIGWYALKSREELLTEEQNSDGYIFNTKYIKFAATTGSSIISRDSIRQDRSLDGLGKIKNSEDCMVDVLYMYINLIPCEWDLGESEEVEKWVFQVAGDSVIRMAQKCNLNHNMFPVATIAPDFDGSSTSALSRIEIISQLQVALNHYYNSMIANQRKAVNDSLVYDPSKISTKHLEDPGPGRLIPLRPSAYGTDINSAVKQLAISDITRANLQDMAVTSDLMKSVTGATDMLQGNLRKGPDRINEVESQSALTGVMDRIERMAQVISAMGFVPLAYMLASQTQQFMEKDIYLDLTSDVTSAKSPEKKLITSKLIEINFSAMPVDVTLGKRNMFDVWREIFAIVSKSETLSAKLDVVKIFKFIAKLGGATNIDEFEAAQQDVQQNVLPDDQVKQLAQAGNIIPIQ